MQGLPIVSVDMGGVLSAIATHKLDEAALTALNELGNVIGDDRVNLKSFVKSNHGYTKTVENCEDGHPVLRRFFGRGRENFRRIIFIKLGPDGKASVIKKRELHSTWMIDLKSVKMSIHGRAALAEEYASMDVDRTRTTSALQNKLSR